MALGPARPKELFPAGLGSDTLNGLGDRSGRFREGPVSTAAAGPETEERIRVFIFRKRGLLAAGGILLGSVWLGLPGPAILAGLILALGALVRSWSNLSLKRVLLTRRLNPLRGFPGDPALLSLEVENRKPLPLAWLEASQRLPAGLATAEQPPPSGPDPRLLRLSTPLLWYRRAAWSQALVFGRRGIYHLSPVRLSSADLFGLVPSQAWAGGGAEVIVYPKIHPLAKASPPSVQPQGESRAATRLFEDPTRALGLRRYTPEIPFKHIHWKASARHGSLQAKIFEPTTTLKTVLLLETEGFEGLKAFSGEVHFELALSFLASLADHLINQGHPVGFLTNSVSARGSDGARYWPGGGLDQLTWILEGLAGLEPRAGRPFTEFMEAVRPELPWGATLALVTARPGEAVLARLEDLKRAGFKVGLFQVGSSPLPRTGIRIRRIMEPTDFAWEG